MQYSISIDGESFSVEISASQNGWNCRLNGQAIAIDFVPVSSNAGSLLVNGKSFDVRRDANTGIFIGARRCEVSIEDPRSWQGRKRRETAQGPQRVIASMPGKIVRVLASEGESIQAGQGIVVVEAMKMQNEIKSPKSGRLQKLMAREGANVNAGEALAIVE